MKKYDKNLRILKKSSKMLYDLVSNEKSRIKIEFNKNKDSFGYIMESHGKKVNIHSVRNIDFEMEKMFDSVKNSDTTIILFGLGEGYAIKYIKSRFINIKKIVVIEPSLEIFKCFLRNYDLIEYLKGISVSFLVNKTPEFIGNILGDYINDDKYKIIHHVSYRIIFEAYYKRMLEQSKKSLKVKIGNYNFQGLMKSQLMINFLSNVDYGDVQSVKMKELLNDKPLLVVAAGPSLNKNMKLIEKLKDKAIVVAVGSAIKILDVNGIIPHFRMAFDPSIIEMKIIEGIDTSVCPIIYSTNLFSEVLKNYEGSKLLVNISNDIGREYFWGNDSDIKNIATAPSIAITAVDMGFKYNSSKVIMIGVDLSISEDKIYADGFSDDRIEHHKNNDMNVKEMVKIKGYNGENVYINRMFEMQKDALELVIDANKDKLVIDATEGGVVLKGTKVMTLSDVIDTELTSVYTINDEIDNLSFNKVQNEDVEDKLNEMLDGIIEINKLNMNRFEMLLKMKEDVNNRKMTGNKDLSFIDNIEKEMKNIKLYKNYVLPSLESALKVIVSANRYDGFDSIERMKFEINKRIKKTGEIKEFNELFYELVKLKLNGEFNNVLKKIYKN